MKAILLAVTIALGVSHAAQKAQAATYYVDFSAGSDSNAGTSTGAPFQHCPGDDNATGTAASTTLSAGDTVVFKGGVAYSGEVDLDWAGSSGNPIIYDGNTAGIWGTGRAQFDLNATYYHAFNGTTARDYITIRGFNIYDAKNVSSASNQTVTRGGMNVTGINYGGTGLISELGAIYNNGGDFWWVSDCKLYEFENWSDLSVPGAETDADAQTSASVPLDQVGINFYIGSHNGVISNVVMWAIGRDCVRLTSCTNTLITNCDFGGDSDAGSNKGYFSVAIRPAGTVSGGALAALTIRDTLFHDGWQYQGDESQQRSHAGDWIHAFGDNDGIFETNWDVYDVIVERCYFWCDRAFSYANGTAYSFLEDDVFNWTWRNNIFINSFAGGVEIERTSNVVFHANTFLDYDHGSGGGSPLYFFTGTGGSYPIDTTLRNNIFVTLNDNSAVQPIATSSSGIGEYPDSDYNLFYSPNNGGNSVRWMGTNYTLAGWRSVSGQDANSVYGNPLFTSQPATGATSGSGDYSLAENSPAVDEGFDLSDFFTDDYNGSTRVAPWEIGAFGVGIASGASVPSVVAPGGPRPNRGGMW